VTAPIPTVHAVAEVATPIAPLDEWRECRATIGRFDSFLADTRKYGFTLVTVLLTANALVTTSDKAVDRPAASIVVIALLLALFMLDNYYWSLLRAAVARAQDLEEKVDGKSIQLSGVISVRVAKTHATDLILAVYGLFVFIAMAIGFTGGVTGSQASAGWLATLVLAGVIVLGVMAASFVIVQNDAPPSRWFYQHVLRKPAA
jgi:hypothetical protein